MGNIYPALGALTGGGTSSLDKIDGAILSDGDGATVILDTGVYNYHLDSTSGASENSPYVISPDTNAGTKRWVLVTPAGAFSHVKANTDSGQSLPDAALTTVVFDNEVQDTLSEYNTTTGVFTATYAGNYIFTSAIRFDSLAWTVVDSASPIIARSVASDIKGSAAVIEVAISQVISINIATVISLAASETAEFKPYVGRVGGGSTLITDEDWNWLTIDRIA